MESKASEGGSLSVEHDPEDGPYFEAMVDHAVMFKGYGIDDLVVSLSQFQKPTKGHPEPGF